MKKISQIWLQWFIGFNDAEGNFQVFPKKRVLKSGDISHYGVVLIIYHYIIEMLY